MSRSTVIRVRCCLVLAPSEPPLRRKQKTVGPMVEGIKNADVRMLFGWVEHMRKDGFILCE